MNTMYVYIDIVTGQYKGKDRLTPYMSEAEQFLVLPEKNPNYRRIQVTYFLKEIDF